MTTLICWPLLNRRSKRAMLRTRKKWGHPYTYEPREILLSRLSQELSMTKTEVRDQLLTERSWLLEHSRYFI